MSLTTVEFEYTNWRGETGNRRVVPMKVFFGQTEYHTTPQWLLKAFDLDKQAIRDFAMVSIRKWRPST